jgi:hypothetical protein
MDRGIVVLIFIVRAWKKEKFHLILHCQIETEAGSAGKQPARDIFD